jgi:crotonobetainyl-CoA:carnitine CoA-transferase CaiB-like acyl-CoA transferase
MGVLNDLKVIEVTRGQAGPRTGFLLSDFGANIIRVDLPGSLRQPPDDMVWLRGRRSIAIDLSRPEGRDLLLRLVVGADILLSEAGLDGVDPVGLGYDELSSVNPRLIWCRISGYGDEGPLSGAWSHDHLVAARYGVYDQPGWREGPTFLPLPIPSIGAGLLALQAIGTALYMRERSGRGQQVTTSLLAGALAFQSGIVSVSKGQPINTRAGLRRGPTGDRPFYSVYECSDSRWLQFGCLSSDFQQRAIQALDIEAEMASLGFGTPAAVEHQQAIRTTVAERMQGRTHGEWAALFEKMDVPYAEAQPTEALFDDAQVRDQGLIINLTDPAIGPMDQMGQLVRFSDETWRQPNPAPPAGADTDAICREAGLSDADITRLREDGVVA